jgi:gliding motility-associated-like protein
MRGTAVLTHLLLLGTCVHTAVAHASDGIFRSTFLANEGQWPERILYKGRSASANVSFLQDGLSFSVVKPEDEHEHDDGHKPEKDHHAEPEFIVWNMTFVNADPAMHVSGVHSRPSVTNYLSSPDPAAWVVHPMEYERVDYVGVYPGIDAQFHMVGLDLEYDYVIHPGGDPAAIRNSYAGIESLALGANGDLLIRTRYGEQKQRAPVCWQLIGGVRRSVNVDFVLINDSTYGFSVRGAYDPAVDLVIDPLFEMVWASYTAALGGSNNINYCFANAMDVHGNVYLTGMVDGSFPVTPGAYSGPGNVQPEIFVAKFSADGTTLLYSTYLPGSSSEFGTSIVVDALGRAYITGVVDLNITGLTNYPSTPNAYQPVHDTGSDAILTVLDPAGSSLVYSTFLGGPSSETGYSLALGPTGIAYVTGTTSYLGFPEVAATDYVQGDKDVFVAKFDINQSGAASLLYSVRIGAGPFNYCSAHGIAVDDAGNAYVTGGVGVGFGSSVFPVTPGAYSVTYSPGMDGGCAYLLKLGPTLPVAITYATYLGAGTGISVDVLAGTGEAYVAGTTETPAFPTTTDALQPSYGGGNGDAFALKMSADGSTLLYATFLGGADQDESTDLVVNSAGEAYVAGLSRGGFPTSPGAYQEAHAGFFSWDMFLVHLDPAGTGYACGGSTYIGGSEDEYYGYFYDYPAPGIDLIDNGGLQDTISMAATTHSQDFPTTPGVYEEDKVNGIADQPVFLKLTCASLAVAPVADFNANAAPACIGPSVDFSNASTVNATSWSWAFTEGMPSTSSSQDPQDIVFPGPGTYPVTLIACNDIGCDTITRPIIIDPVDPPVIDLGNDTWLCTGGALLLDAGAGSTSYAWWNSGDLLTATTSSITVNVGGTYSVLVQDENGCAGTDTVEVTFLTPPELSASYVIEAIPCGPSSVRLEAAGGPGQIAWDLGDGNNGAGTTITHTYDSAGTYLVNVTMSNGSCDSTATLVVEVPADGGAALVLGPVPNVFSPNGDGTNDVFLPLGSLNGSGCASLVIMNRWGQRIRSDADASIGWNGKADDGALVPDGVYFYILTIGDRQMTGHVELLR